MQFDYRGYGAIAQSGLDSLAKIQVFLGYLYFLNLADYNRAVGYLLSKAEQNQLNLDFSESEEMTGSQIILPHGDILQQ